MKRYDETSTEIGRRIRQSRLRRNMTQAELAKNSGMRSPQQISNIERGTAKISLVRFMDICRALNADADYLLFGSTVPNTIERLHTSIEKLTPDQINLFIEIARIYADMCEN